MAAKPLPTSLRLDPKIKKALEKAADEDSRSMSNMIEKILTDWLRERGYLPKL
jgi:hypothetical protein